MLTWVKAYPPPTARPAASRSTTSGLATAQSISLRTKGDDSDEVRAAAGRREQLLGGRQGVHRLPEQERPAGDDPVAGLRPGVAGPGVDHVPEPPGHPDR